MPTNIITISREHALHFTIDGRYALYAQLNGIALYAFLKLNLALLKSKPVIFLTIYF